MKITCEFLIQENGEEVFHREFEVSDSIACVKSSYLISIPILRNDLNQYIFSHYHQNEEEVVTGFEIHLKENGDLCYEFAWANLSGKKACVYAALKGSSEYVCDEIVAYVKQL